MIFIAPWESLLPPSPYQGKHFLNDGTRRK